MSIGNLSLADTLPVVAYLDALDGELRFEKPKKSQLIVQSGAQFSPGFSVVTVNQRVEMRNDDEIFHNVFSFSAPNDFDLGMYPRGESRFHRFSTPGLVRFYCSIHDPMHGTLFVSPSPYFALVDRNGHFSIDGVPPGEYRLRIFSPVLPELERAIALDPGQALTVLLEFKESASLPASDDAG